MDRNAVLTLKASPSNAVLVGGIFSSGKSECAQQLAHLLGYAYIDTDFALRAMTFVLQSESMDINTDQVHMDTVVASIFRCMKFSANSVMLEGTELTRAHLFNPRVDEQLRTLMSKPEVCGRLYEIMNRFNGSTHLVADGLDVFTIFPETRFNLLKFFISADLQDRVRRLMDICGDVTRDGALEEIRKRDKSARMAFDPADKRIVHIDTTGKTQLDVVQAMYLRCLETGIVPLRNNAEAESRPVASL